MEHAVIGWPLGLSGGRCPWERNTRRGWAGIGDTSTTHTQWFTYAGLNRNVTAGNFALGDHIWHNKTRWPYL